MEGTQQRQTSGTDVTCTYSFDPTKETDARLETTWECPHEAYGDSEYCPFHMTENQRATHGVTAEELVDLLERNLRSDDPRLNEYVGATLPYLTMTYRTLDAGTNHVINFQHADIDGLEVVHGRIDQGLNLREATVGRLKLEDAVVGGTVDADDLTVEGRFVTYETVFEEEVSFAGADFGGHVNADETTFNDDTSFAGATFHESVHCRNSAAHGTSHELEDHISFADAEFRDEASFRQTDFEYVTFAGATFQDAAGFDHATFDGDTRFGGVRFERVADFDEARFFQDVCFEDAAFEALAEFRGAEFNGGSRSVVDDVTFEGARFDGPADFELAKFRYANFRETSFADDLVVREAAFGDQLDGGGLAVAGEADLRHVTFGDDVAVEDATFEGNVAVRGAEFEGDVTFDGTAFAAATRFVEVRFREDASFRECTFRATATFAGAVFEGEAEHLHENATFRDAEFRDVADFTATSFTNASFWDVTFHDECDFEDSEFLNAAEFRVHPGADDIYVDFTNATVGGGRIVEAGGDGVPYDFTRATLGNITLEAEGDEHDLLDHFRFCLTEFDRFDFSDHHGYLERNGWNVHDFIGADAGTQAVEMTNAVIEETYREAMNSAEAVGDTPAMREFEFKRYYYNRKKNVEIVLNEYALNTFGRLKKTASIGLNLFMQVTCGYGNRLPRIAAWTFLLPMVYGVLYVLGGPFETQAGVLGDGDTAQVLFDGMYYSYISFSTIGYGDIGPVGWAAKLLAMSQGMLNGLLFTLLTFTLFKRAMGGS